MSEFEPLFLAIELASVEVEPLDSVGALSILGEDFSGTKLQTRNKEQRNYFPQFTTPKWNTQTPENETKSFPKNP